MQSTNVAALPGPAAPAPSHTRLLPLLACGAGVSVASLYYSQPLLPALAQDLHASEAAAGWVPTLTQLGYALGLLFLAPLADRFDRRHVIAGKAVALVLALLLVGLAGSMPMLLAASLLLGVAATLAQDFVPAAAAIARPEERGRLVGTVMTGLLGGILLSRVLSGAVAGQAGWRAIFLVAAAAVAVLGVAAWRRLPPFPPAARVGYGALLASLAALWRRHPALRRAALAQGVLAIGFSAFWSTLAVMLHGAPFHLGSAAAGAFGIAGAAGALVAPLAGRLADRRGPAHVVRCGAALAALAFAGMALASGLERDAQLLVLALGTVAFDLGVQGALIAHQTIVYGLDPAARSRLNALLMVSMFAGMAAGAALGSLLLAQLGWVGVTAMATLTSLAALAMQAGRSRR